MSALISSPDGPGRSPTSWRAGAHHPRYWLIIAPAAVMEAMLLLILWEGYARGWA